MEYRVELAPEAKEQLRTLFRYISMHGSPVTARDYTTAINQYCKGLCTTPKRGSVHSDLMPGLRIVGYKNCTIAFSVDDDQRRVTVHGIFYGGQNYEDWLS
jgi:toxin ParE1/3/4